MTLTFVALLVVLVFLILAATALLAMDGGEAGPVAPDDPSHAVRPARRTLADRLLSGDQLLAHRLNMDLRVWLLLRLAFSAAMAVLAALVLESLPLGIFVAALAWLAATWYMRLRADRRELQISEALLQWVTQVANASRASQSRSLADILEERARYPGPVLQDVLAPLASRQGSLRDRLVEVNRRASTPLCAQMVIAILVARSYSPRRLVQLIDEQLIPAMRSDLEVLRKNRIILTESYQQIGIVCLIMVALFAIALRGEQTAAFYSSPLGLLLLIVVAGSIAGLIWWASKSVKPVAWVNWDVDGLTERVEGMSGRV